MIKKSNCTSNITAGHHWHFFPYKNPQNFYSHQLIYSDNILLPAILLCNEAWNLFWSSILTFMDLFAFSNSACFYNVLFCFTTLCTAKKEEKKKSSNCMSTMEEWHKVHICILRGPQNFAKSPPYFCLQLHRTKVREILQNFVAFSQYMNFTNN